MGPQRPEKTDGKTTKTRNDGKTSKKRKRGKERGRTVLELVSAALREKKPIELEWDKVHRLPTGTYAGKFSSWIGLTARRHVPCTVETWEDVDEVTRRLILDSITGAFTVLQDRHDWCLIKAGNLWRKWKCTLVREWLYDEKGAIQRTRPDLYNHITQDEWNAFVASHITDRFKEISAKNKKNASMKKGQFYGSRGGYRGIEIKVKEDFAKKGVVLEKVDRHLTYLKGHTPNNGDQTEYHKEVALKIEELEKEVKAGKFVPEGREDILAKALGKPEHGGRVRGVPDGITITEYFGKGPRKPTEAELLKEEIKTMQTQISNMQMMMVHFWQSGEKPSQEVLETFMKVAISSEGSKACESTQGSQSMSIQVTEEPVCDKPAGEEIPHEEPSKQIILTEEPVREKSSREEIPHEEPPREQGWKECDLSLPGNSNKMVASGLMYMESIGEFISVHGTSLLDGYKKVEVKKVNSGSENAKLPVPVRDDLIVLKDALDSYVQWPHNHIHSRKVETTMKKKKKMTNKGSKSKAQKFPPAIPTFLGVEVSPEFKQKLRTPLMKSLVQEAKILKTSGALINVPIDEHVLHLPQTCLITYEDLIQWCDEGELSASHITIFMRYLSDLTETMNSTSLYGFLCPEPLSKFAAVESEDYRSDYIARAMTCTECGRGRKLIFAAYPEGDHWMLAAISPSESIVYWCDPLGHPEPRQFFVETITRAFEKRNSIDPLAGFDKKPLTWKVIKCPRQPVGSILCGYFVCRYMLEIVRGRYVTIIPNFMINAPMTYTVDQIDEVRNIWAEFILKFKPQTTS